MAHYKSTFKISIMTPEALLYQNEIESVFFTGDQGEYELLPYHYPVLGILTEGKIVINWRETVTIKFGLVKFFANDCVVLVEEIERIRPKRTKKLDEDVVIDEDSKV